MSKSIKDVLEDALNESTTDIHEMDLESIDDPDVRKILEAIKSVIPEDYDSIAIYTPQFNRNDNIVPATPGMTSEWFDSLKLKSSDELKALGLGHWDEGHFLFPEEWYDYIPDGYEVVGISNKLFKFKKDKTSKDTRYGLLAYGIKLNIQEFSSDNNAIQ